MIPAFTCVIMYHVSAFDEGKSEIGERHHRVSLTQHDSLSSDDITKERVSWAFGKIQWAMTTTTMGEGRKRERRPWE